MTRTAISFVVGAILTLLTFLGSQPRSALAQYGGQDIQMIASSWLPTSTIAPNPDIDGDGIVNGQDVALVSDHWLQTGFGIAEDVNHDGVVNGQDIAAVASHWEATIVTGYTATVAEDVTLIASNWLQTAGGGTGGGTAAPEPSTLILAALGGLALLACRRRR
jgi:hypothetical protein